ncbi:hypothetical protein MUK42_01347 [Musa troglodytarum]|uniref:WRC domain-containing protein n=1 Tax=Musa troglodytarum TaxID=320322 RepID=A0A9E7G7C2_9LILI|nr:hypothetical protein MUK42_12194 [Musa troglodytarum]URE07963.1 hypothetical protein MUK42_01347 [Musa troglodytarum]
MEPQICMMEAPKSESDAEAEAGKAKEKRNWVAQIACKRSDGKGWQCKRVAAEGNSLCDHHLSMSRARSSSSSVNIEMSTAKRARKKRNKAESETVADDGFKPVKARRGPAEEGLDGGDDKMDGPDRDGVPFDTY